MHGELNQLIPSFVKRAQLNEYLAGTSAAAKSLAATVHVNGPPRATKEPVMLIDYDAQAEEKIIAAILYAHARHPLEQLRQIAAAMSGDERRQDSRRTFRQTAPPARQAQPGFRERLLHLRHPR